MNKEEFIIFENNLIKGIYSPNDFYPMVYNYCIEKGKSKDIVDKYLPMLFASPLQAIILHAVIKYYEIKYQIYTLSIKRDNKIHSILHY